jgi:hypothetical protein
VAPGLVPLLSEVLSVYVKNPSEVAILLPPWSFLVGLMFRSSQNSAAVRMAVGFWTQETQQMPMSMGEEKQRISERLQRLDAEREKLSAQLNELEIAERVVARFGGKAATTAKLERARPANAAAGGRKHRAQGKRQMPTISLSDATLKAVQAHDQGATASEVLNHLSREFGMAVRPNHLGMALQRHRRAGRLDNRDQRWHLPRSA